MRFRINLAQRQVRLRCPVLHSRVHLRWADAHDLPHACQPPPGNSSGAWLASVRGSGIRPIDAIEGHYIINFRGTQGLLQLTFWFNRVCCIRA